MEPIIVFVAGKAVTIDADDLPLFQAHKWRFSTNGYVRRHRGENSDSYLHRELLRAPVFAFVDHINGDQLDNRKANLRFCHHTQNMWNRAAVEGTSKHKGVGRHFDSWRARITYKGKRHDIGRFATEDEAALAYNYVARKMHGSFARLNEVEGTTLPSKGMSQSDCYWAELLRVEEAKNVA